MTAPTQPQQQRLSAAQIAALIALVEAQAALRKRITATAVAAARAAFATFTGWWDPGEVERAIAQVLRVVQPSQRQMAQVTDAYLARAATIMTGRTVRPVGAVDITRLRTAITEEVARDLVDGKITPAYVVLGEFEPATGKVAPADSIDDDVPMAIPEATTKTTTTVAAKSASTSRTLAAAPRTTTTRVDTQADLRVIAQQLRTSVRDQAAALLAARRAATGAATIPRQATAGTSTTATTSSAAVSTDGLVSPANPYGRIADQVRFQVAAGSTADAARRRALVRIEAVAATDITLAVREQVRATLGRVPGARRFRRILRPELSESGPCGLCVVAADRLYRKEHLLPIHDRCVCEVLPVIGDMDPGLQLNASDLRRIYDAAGGTGGDVKKGGKRYSGNLKNLRVALAEHGELGPTLVNADQHHRGPAEVARTKHPDRAVREQAKLDAFTERLDGLLSRQGRGESGLEKAIAWQTDRVERLRRELAGQPAASTPTSRRRAPRRRTTVTV